MMNKIAIWWIGSKQTVFWLSRVFVCACSVKDISKDLNIWDLFEATKMSGTPNDHSVLRWGIAGAGRISNDFVLAVTTDSPANHQARTTVDNHLLVYLLILFCVRLVCCSSISFAWNRETICNETLDSMCIRFLWRVGQRSKHCDCLCGESESGPLCNGTRDAWCWKACTRRETDGHE